MAQASIYGSYVRGPHQPEEEPLPLVQRRTDGHRAENRWMPPSTYQPTQRPYDEIDEEWAELGQPERVSTDDEYWDEILSRDGGADREWRRRRPRRIAVKMLGWSSILAAFLGVAYIVMGSANARDAMLHWGTFATVGPVGN